MTFSQYRDKIGFVDKTYIHYVPYHVSQYRTKGWNKGVSVSMNQYEAELVEKQRQYHVVKGNELVQKSRFELSLPEQKTIAYICSMIKPVDAVDRVQGAYQLEYEFNIREYCKVCGFDYDNGKNYADIKATLKRLRDKSMWLTMENGSETLVGWLSRVTVNKKSGIVQIRLDDILVPFLFDLKQRFTEYRLIQILGMKSAYSVRLYELMKSYAHQKSKTFDIDELKRLLMVDGIESYNRFPDFRRYVLEIALKEINLLTDLNVSFETIKRGRKVEKVKFRIDAKEQIPRILAEMETGKILDGET